MKSKLLKTCIVVAGYIAAFGAACGVEYVYELMTQEMRAQSSGGMVAEGDLTLFLFVFSLVSLVPTGLALYFTRSSLKFWSFFSIAAVGFALTGPAMEMFNVTMKAFHFLDLPMRMPWALFSFLCLARVFAAPVMACGFLISALIAKERATRKKLLIAMGIEGALCLWVGMLLFLFQRFF